MSKQTLSNVYNDVSFVSTGLVKDLHVTVGDRFNLSFLHKDDDKTHNHELQVAAVMHTTQLTCGCLLTSNVSPSLFHVRKRTYMCNSIKNYGNSGSLGDLRFAFDLETDSVELSDLHFLSTGTFTKQYSVSSGHSNEAS